MSTRELEEAGIVTNVGCRDGEDVLMVHVPNLDDYSVDPADYVRLEREFRDLAAVMERVATCVQAKRTAMEFRLLGRIETARRLEEHADALRSSLPSWAQW